MVEPGTLGEVRLAGARDGHLVALFGEAGIADVRGFRLSVRVTHSSFSDWWEPYTLGVGPAGDHVAQLDPGQLVRLRTRARELLGDGPITITGSAWCAVGRA